MSLAIALKRIGVIILALLCGIIASGGFLVFTFRIWEGMIAAIYPERSEAASYFLYRRWPSIARQV